MDKLCQTYGYASDGESFSIADPNEVWLMELVGKGKEKGAVWVASRVPDGYVGSTANQARTQTWDWTDTNGTNVLWAEDVVDFAVKKGLYPATAKKEDFSFADVYDPPSFGGLRLGVFFSLSNGCGLQSLVVNFICSLYDLQFFC